MLQEGKPGASTRNLLGMWQLRWQGGGRFNGDLVKDTIADEDELLQAVSNNTDR